MLLGTDFLHSKGICLAVRNAKTRLKKHDSPGESQLESLESLAALVRPDVHSAAENAGLALNIEGHRLLCVAVTVEVG
jgi:hypothetical protein